MKLFLTTVIALFSLNASADIVEGLPKTDALARVATAVGTQLRDGNISTGSTTLWAGEVKNKRRIASAELVENLAAGGFAQEFKVKTGEVLPKGSKVQITTGRFIDGDDVRGTVHKMTAALMESNDYNTKNKELWESQARYLWAVLRQLPVSEKTWVVHIATKVLDSDVKEMRSIQYFLLVNQDGRAVQFFTIEGTM